MVDAISPQEALGNKLQVEQENINALVKQVNQRLSLAWNGRDTVRVPISKDFNTFVIQRVVEIFRRKGWSVRHDAGDQRDQMNDLVFSAKNDAGDYYGR